MERARGEYQLTLDFLACFPPLFLRKGNGTSAEAANCLLNVFGVSAAVFSAFLRNAMAKLFGTGVVVGVPVTILSSNTSSVSVDVSAGKY